MIKWSSCFNLVTSSWHEYRTSKSKSSEFMSLCSLLGSEIMGSKPCLICLVDYWQKPTKHNEATRKTFRYSLRSSNRLSVGLTFSIHCFRRSSCSNCESHKTWSRLSSFAKGSVKKSETLVVILTCTSFRFLSAGTCPASLCQGRFHT